LNRHFPACKRSEAGTEGQMLIVQRRMFHRRSSPPAY
jgi:hypothetical protein